MTRKSKKGIVGKKLPTTNHRENTGVGISFTQEHVSDGDMISSLVEKKEKEENLK